MEQSLHYIYVKQNQMCICGVVHVFHITFGFIHISINRITLYIAVDKPCRIMSQKKLKAQINMDSKIFVVKYIYLENDIVNFQKLISTMRCTSV